VPVTIYHKVSSQLAGRNWVNKLTAKFSDGVGWGERRFALLSEIHKCAMFETNWSVGSGSKMNLKIDSEDKHNKRMSHRIA